MNTEFPFPALSLFLSAMLVAACQSPDPHHHRSPQSMPAQKAHHAHRDHSPSPAVVLEPGNLKGVDDIVPELAGKRVVYIGETHNRYDHHLLQLDLIEKLLVQDPDMAIGMEAFQQPYQHVLDEYIAGNLDTRDFLKKSEYYQRWGYDYRLYAPILEFAMEKKIPVIALNVPKELTRKVGRGGLDSLSDEERARIPEEIDYTDQEYRQRLQAIFEEHPAGNGKGFDQFHEVQLVWDEGMAEQVAHYLNRHPEHYMVVLAGSGHLAYGSGIPQRVHRRIPVDAAIVLSDPGTELDPDIADYLVLQEKRSLPPRGKIGILMEDGEDGVIVERFTSNSAGQDAGMKKRDRILAIDDQPVTMSSDVGAAMWDRRPGESLTVTVRRERWLFGEQDLEFDLVLR